MQLSPLSGCGLLYISIHQTAKIHLYIYCESTTLAAHVHKMMTLYDYSRLHNQGSSHNRVSKIQFLHHPPLLLTQPRVIISLCFSARTCFRSPHSWEQSRACRRRSLRLRWDLGPNHVTFGSSFGHLITRSKLTRIGRSSGQSTGCTEAPVGVISRIR